MIATIKKPRTGGGVLLEKHGSEYFSKLAKKGAKKRRAAMKLWEMQQNQKPSVSKKK